MKILVLNCGSSSLKYQVIDMETRNPIAKGLVDRRRVMIKTRVGRVAAADVAQIVQVRPIGRVIETPERAGLIIDCRQGQVA